MGDNRMKKGKGHVHEDNHDDQQQHIQQHIQHPPPPPPCQIQVGFKFKPSEDELVSIYLKSKIEDPHGFQYSHLIPEKDIYDYPPQQLLEGNDDAYFFTRTRKIYGKGNHVHRIVKDGYGHWRNMYGTHQQELIEGRKTAGYKVNHLKFYIGKNQKDCKPTEWFMKEYVLIPDKKEKLRCRSRSSRNTALGDWVLCRIHTKKNAKRSCPDTEGCSSNNTALGDCDGNSKKQKIEKEIRDGGKGKAAAGIQIEDHENPLIVEAGMNPPPPQFTYCIPQCGANNLVYSMVPIPNVYQFGGYLGMTYQVHHQQHNRSNSSNNNSIDDAASSTT